MRKITVVLMVLAFAVAVPAMAFVPAFGTGVDLYSTKTNEVHAGVTQLAWVTTESGKPMAFWTGGFLRVPAPDDVGVFEGFDYLWVNPTVIGVKDRHIVAVTSELEGAGESAELKEDGWIRIKIASLPIGQPMAIVTSVVNDQGQRKAGGLIPLLVKVVSLGFADLNKRIRETDEVALVFTTVGTGKFIHQFGFCSLGKPPEEWDGADRDLARSAWLLEKAPTLQEADGGIGYQLLSTWMARRAQGYGPEFADVEQGPDPQVVVLQQQLEEAQKLLETTKGENNGLRELVDQLRKAIDELTAEQTAAPGATYEQEVPQGAVAGEAPEVQPFVVEWRDVSGQPIEGKIWFRYSVNGGELHENYATQCSSINWPGECVGHVVLEWKTRPGPWQKVEFDREPGTRVVITIQEGR